MIPLLLLWASPALAEEAESVGTQFAVFSGGVDFLRSRISKTYSIDKSQVGGTFGCYDEVGIRDFNLDIPGDDVDAYIEGGKLYVSVEFGTISGYDMEIYTEATDVFDACISFDTDFDALVLRDASLTGSMVSRWWTVWRC